MITDSFLNSCFSVLLNKNMKIKRTKSLYRDINDIIKFNEKRNEDEIPISIKSKLECLKTILTLLLNDKTVDNLIDSIILSDKFKQYSDFLDIKINETTNDLITQDNLNQIRLRKKYASLIKNYNELEKIVNTIKDGSFDSIDELVGDYEQNVKVLYTNVMESNRVVSVEASASLDLVKDNYDAVVDKMKKKYDKDSKTPTGFNILDKDILYGGYEPTRLYIFAGGSGAGKSAFLSNTIIKSASKPFPSKDSNPGDIKRVYVYVTMENSIEESLTRSYAALFDKKEKEVTTLDKDVIKNNLTSELLKYNSTIVMKYFPGLTISTFDLMSVLDDVIEQYGKNTIAGLYVDYLDLLKADTKYDMYRLELGHITLSLKSLAVQYNIPIITATQLAKRVYTIEDPKELGLDMMSESIKKVEHADFVALLGKDRHDDKKVYGVIGKNRSGRSNIDLDFIVDYERYKFIDVVYHVNKEKKDISSDKYRQKITENFKGFLPF